MTRWNRSKRKIKEKGDERIFSLVFRTNDPRLGSKFCSVYGGCLGSQFLLVKPFFETIYAPRNPRILWILSPIPFREPMEIYPSHFYFTKRLDNRPNFPSSPLIISLYIKIRLAKFCEKLSRNCRSLPTLCHDSRLSKIHFEIWERTMLWEDDWLWSRRVDTYNRWCLLR